jgi:DNA modification methylase
VSHLTEAQIKAFRVADNRLVELRAWDKGALAIEFAVLIDLNVDLTLTGFEIPEIDLTIGEEALQAAPEENPFDLIRKGSPISSLRRAWRLGEHELLCGSVLNLPDVDRLMGGRKAAMAFLDPPYNVRIQGHVGRSGKICHPEIKMASGELDGPEFQEFLRRSFEVVSSVLARNALAYICIDCRSASLLDVVGRSVFRRLVNWATWVKDLPGMGSFFRSQSEFILIYCDGDGPFLNNVQLGRFGRNRSNVWNYPGVIGINGPRRRELEPHPTPKPVTLVQDAILDCTRPRDLVIDTFLGGGATLMACERSGRVCRGMEIDSHYVDVCVRRWQAETGRKATCANSGVRFDDLAKRPAGGAQMLPATSDVEEQP